jgi:hypothetical protein
VQIKEAGGARDVAEGREGCGKVPTADSISDETIVVKTITIPLTVSVTVEIAEVIGAAGELDGAGGADAGGEKVLVEWIVMVVVVMLVKDTVMEAEMLGS